MQSEKAVRLLTVFDQQRTEPTVLIWWEGDDTSEVVVAAADLFLAEETQHMVEGRSGFRDDVKVKARGLEENVFVVDEELSKQAQVLTVELDL